MFVKESVDSIACTLNKGKKNVCKFYEFLKGTSIKNKASFDIQVKNDKSFVPLCHHGFSYNKEWRVMPIVIVLLGAVSIIGILKSVFCRH